MKARPRPSTTQQRRDGWAPPDPSARIVSDFVPRPSPADVTGRGLRRRRAQEQPTAEMPVTIATPAMVIDLPSLTGQISGVLAVLRQKYGVAYRSHTWIDKMLPAHGAEIRDPALARDLLAAAALDAGGIRADVTSLAESHPREHIVATGNSILFALQNVLAACVVPTDLLPAPLPSDPSSWPTSTC